MISALQACKLIKRRNDERERLDRLERMFDRIDVKCSDHKKVTVERIAKQREVIQQVEKEVFESGLPGWLLEVNPDKILLVHLETILK